VPVRSDPERDRPQSERDWSQIASPTPTKLGTEYVVIGKDAGVFRSLRVDAVSGIVVLRRIMVLTHRGSWTTFNVDRRLDRRHPSFYVNLGASTHIAQVVITTDHRVAGAYTIYGSSGRLGPVLVARR